MEKATETEPPFERPQVFMIGQDRRGNWVVRDQSGMRGGLFVGYAEALRYVRDEAGNHPQPVAMVSGAFELDTTGTRRPPVLPHRFSDEEGSARPSNLSAVEGDQWASPRPSKKRAA